MTHYLVEYTIMDIIIFMRVNFHAIPCKALVLENLLMHEFFLTNYLKGDSNH